MFRDKVVFSKIRKTIKQWRGVVEPRWNVMAHGDARQEKWRGNKRMEWVASKRHMTAEHRLAQAVQTLQADYRKSSLKPDEDRAISSSYIFTQSDFKFSTAVCRMSWVSHISNRCLLSSTLQVARQCYLPAFLLTLTDQAACQETWRWTLSPRYCKLTQCSVLH